MVLIAIMFLVSPASAVIVKVEKITNFNMTFNVDSGHVKCDITIKNLVNNPIVPGIGEIRLQKQEQKKIIVFPVPNTVVLKSVNVSNVRAYSGNAHLPVKIIHRKNYTVIEYEIWKPIEPGKTYTFTLEFNAPSLIDRGIFFKSVTIPVGSDVDICKLEIHPVSSWHLTYSYPEMKNSMWVASIPASHIVFFTAEYSLIPMPTLPVRGYIVFWGALIVMMVAFVVIKKRQKTKSR
jgi:hypothetical protein